MLRVIAAHLKKNIVTFMQKKENLEI